MSKVLNHRIQETARKNGNGLGENENRPAILPCGNCAGKVFPLYVREWEGDACGKSYAVWREPRRARYLPMMSYSMLTMDPTLVEWKLVLL